MTEVVLIEILAVPAERSRGRHNPRVVKRKMSNFPTKSRSAAGAAPCLRYDEHIVIVAPPEPIAPHHGWSQTSRSHGRPAGANQSPNLLAGPCSSVAGQRSAAPRLLPAAQLETAGLQRGRRPPAPDLPSCPENSPQSSLSQRYWALDAM